jgi:hypothetical protein
MGNGALETIRDVVYVRPESFESGLTPKIAAELDKFNRPLVDQGCPYLLLGFGRWGSSDPWLGIPVEWGQIAGARVIVESTLPGMDVEPSQGAHWDWVDRQPAVAETDLVRHVRFNKPLRIKVDGRSGHGAVWHP